MRVGPRKEKRPLPEMLAAAPRREERISSGALAPADEII
jgi:hypothetical protein